MDALQQQLWLLLLLLAAHVLRGAGDGVTRSSSSSSPGCPEGCDCRWKGGKETAECVNASFAAVPAGLDRDTQVLDLSLNYLPRLEPGLFLDRAGLPNLQKVFLSYCSVSEVEEHAFRGLTNLVELDLSHNALQDFPRFLPGDCKYLMRLNLRGNLGLTRLRREHLQHLPDLNSLDLGECGLEQVEAGALAGSTRLEYLRLEGNRLRTISPKATFPPSLRDLTLHQNRWHCDCHLLGLRAWLLDRTLPWSPQCRGPPRLIGEAVTALDAQEFACLPEVNPTSSYLEVIEGKNVSLVCTVKAVPSAHISWLYRDTFINNGSTLLSDIDLRHYYHVETPVVAPASDGDGDGDDPAASVVRSELFLASGATVDDNGTFSCAAENQAGRAVAAFTLHVVVPMPPKPPQDVVEERFDLDYAVALGVAGALVLLIASVGLALAVMRCRNRAREDRQRRQQQQQQQEHHRKGSCGSCGGGNGASAKEGRATMIRSKSGGEVSCSDSMSTQLTGSASSSRHHGLSTHSSSSLYHQQRMTPSSSSAHHHHHRNCQPALPSSSNSQNSFTDLTLESRKAKGNALPPSPDLLLNHVIHKATAAAADLEMRALRERQQDNDSEESTGDQDSCYHESTLRNLSAEQQQRRRSSLELLRQRNDPEQLNQSLALSPPKPFADSILETPTAASAGRSFSTMKRHSQHGTVRGQDGGQRPSAAEAQQAKRQCRTLPRKPRSGKASSPSSSKSILPPPPQYKGVHFAPEVKDTTVAEMPPPPAIPLEGLPKGPAKPNRSTSAAGDATVVVIPSASETVPITVRKPSGGPPVPIKPKMTASSSMTFAPVQQQQQHQNVISGQEPPPVPPHKTPPPPPLKGQSLIPPQLHHPRQVLAADKVRFDSPDEGFNEEHHHPRPPPNPVTPTSSAAAAAAPDASTSSSSSADEAGPLLC